MKGLLVKDLRLVLQQKKFFVLLLFLAIMLNFNSDGTFAIGYLTGVGSIFVLSSITYDEYDNGYLFLMTLPIMKKSFAVEKYVFGIIINICAWTTGFLISLIFIIYKGGGFSPLDLLTESIIFIPVFSILISILLPLQLKFGYEKGKIAMVIAFAIIALVSVLCIKGLLVIGIDIEAYYNSLSGLHAALVDLIAFVTAAAAAAISCAASIRIMEKREF